jgi:hypothetical protein
MEELMLCIIVILNSGSNMKGKDCVVFVLNHKTKGSKMNVQREEHGGKTPQTVHFNTSWS